jgi:hypothetical protein
MRHQQTQERPSKATVVMLHGLLRSRQHMNKLAQALTKDGYRVINVDYPTRTAPLEELIDIVWAKLEQAGVDKAPKLDMVGYSLGALIARGLIHQHQDLPIDRVVLLAPPNDGSEVADFHQDNPLYQWIAGPVGQQLTTGNPMLSQILGESLDNVYVGIIAGSQTIDPLHSHLFPGPHDGKVSVFSTLLPGAKDHIVVEANHTFFPQTEAVIEQTRFFLEHGYFNS